MSVEENKEIVGRWFTEFWGKDFNPAVIDDLAAPTSASSTPCTPLAAAASKSARSRPPSGPPSPTSNFWGTADLIAEGDYVVGQWEGGGTHTGPAFDDPPIGALPADTPHLRSDGASSTGLPVPVADRAEEASPTHIRPSPGRCKR